jgi:hypothetical protein
MGNFLTDHVPEDDGFLGKPTRAEQDRLDKIYNGDGVRSPLPPAEPGHFYSWSPVMSVIDQRGPELWASTGMEASAQQQYRATARAIERTTGLPESLVATIIDYDINARLAGARVLSDEEAEAEAVATDKEIAANNAVLREEVTRKYGAKEGEARLAAARRWTRSKPALQKLLDDGRLGSRPEIVMPLLDHLFSIGFR